MCRILVLSTEHRTRCARNCFMCPNCRNTLAAVPADPESSDGRIPAGVAEGPYIMYCNYCRWDSAEIGITFEKPTGLAGASLAIHSLLRLIGRLQHSCKSTKILRQIRWNSSVSRSTLITFYAPPPRASRRPPLVPIIIPPTTHIRFIPIPSQLLPLLPWPAIFLGLANTMLSLEVPLGVDMAKIGV